MVTETEVKFARLGRFIMSAAVSWQETSYPDITRLMDIESDLERALKLVQELCEHCSNS